MKANAFGVEFTIVLSDDEISRLEREVLTGKVKVRDRESLIGDKPYFLKIDETPKHSYFCHVKFLPKTADYANWFGFVFIVSSEGYKHLKEFGSCGDRVGFSGCKLSIYSEEKYSQV